jgi:hypothetical protein
MKADELRALAEGIYPAMQALENACALSVAQAVMGAEQGRPVVVKDERDWNSMTDAFADRDAFFDTMMPDERAAIRLMNAAFDRLKRLGWREAVYCPKDGSSFDAIEAGSTGIHSCHYEGEWPTGRWWVAADGDLYPSRPILYRPTEQEKVERQARMDRARASLIDSQTETM